MPGCRLPPGERRAVPNICMGYLVLPHRHATLRLVPRCQPMVISSLFYALGVVAGGAAGPSTLTARTDGNRPHLLTCKLLVSAWGDDWSNEIMAIPELLKTLAPDGCIVTIDAMGCQKRIAQTIRNRGTDYVLALKANQAQLYTAVVETFAVEKAEGLEGCAHDCHQTVNKNHGRIEARYRWATDTLEYIQYVDPEGV